MSKLKSQLDKISESANKIKDLNFAASHITAFSKAVDQLNNIKTPNLTKLNSQMKKLSEIASEYNGITVGGGGLSGFVSEINTLSNISVPNLTKLNNQIIKLRGIADTLNTMPDIRDNTANFTAAIKPFETLGKSNLNSFLRSLERLPEVSKALNTMDLDRFSKSLTKITSQITPLANAMDKLGRGYSVLPSNIKRVISSNQQLAESSKKLEKSKTSLTSVIGKTKIKLLALFFAYTRISSVLGDCLASSNEYVENLNLFTVAMGDSAKEALNFAEKVNDLLGIDVSEWIRNQGVFKQITTGFGVVEEKANLMSKNLTQLGYDIASFFNISTEESMQKLQSGISGELEPLRRLGYALDAATLQQIAYDHGIQQNINTMTQAQKSQLRYLAIMEQSKNSMGDMARTIVTPANSMRILNQQFEQLKRAVGNVVSVFAVKLIPYIQVAVRLLTDLANELAAKWGFELPEIDYSGSGLSSITDEMSDLSDDANTAKDNVTDMIKEVQRLAGFDELNILNRDKEDTGSGKNAAAEDISGLTDWNIDLPEYDFLAGLDEQTNELYKKAKKKLGEIIDKFKNLKKWIEKNKSILEALATVFGGLWAVSKVKKLLGFLKDIYDWFKKLKIVQDISGYMGAFIEGFKGSNASTFFGKFNDGAKKARDEMTILGKISTGVISGIVGGFAGFDFMKKFCNDTLTWKDALLDVGIAAGAIGIAFAIGGPIAGGIAAVGTLIGGIAGYIATVNENLRQTYDAVANLSDNGGIKISEVTQEFIDQYQPLVDLNDKVKEYKTTIEDNEGKIATATEIIKSYGDNLSGLNDKLTEADVSIIKQNFETIASATKDNIGLETQTIIETFTKSMENMPDSMKTSMSKTINALNYLNEKLSGNVSKAETYINEYYDAILNGAEPTAEQKEHFDQAIHYFELKMSETNDKVKEYKKQIAEFDISTIDFENYDTFKKSMDELGTSAESALKSVKESKEESLKSIESIFSEVKLQYEAGFIDEAGWQFAKETYENAKTTIIKAAEENTKQIKDDLGNILGQVQTQYNDFATSTAMEQAKNSIEKRFKIKMPDWNENQWDLYEQTLAEKLKTVVEYNKNFQDEISGVADKGKINVGDYMNTLIDEWDDIEWSAYRQKLYYSQTTDALTKYMLDGFRHSIKINSNGTLKAFDGLAGDMKTMWEIAWGLTSNSSTVTKDYGAKIGSGMVTGMLAQTPNIAVSTASIIQNVKDGLTTDVTDKGKNVIKTFADGIKTTKYFVSEALSRVNPDIKSSLNIDLADTGKTVGESFSNGFSNGLTGVVNACNDTLRNYESFEVELMNAYNDAVPAFQTMMNGISAVVGTAMGQIESINYTANGRQIPGYATGGFPSRADLFFANEDGRPEMIGRIGSKTAVANTDQIIVGIANGVKQAILETGGINRPAESGGQQGDIYVFIDSEEVSYRVERRTAAKAKRTGGG